MLPTTILKRISASSNILDPEEEKNSQWLAQFFSSFGVYQITWRRITELTPSFSFSRPWGGGGAWECKLKHLHF